MPLDLCLSQHRSDAQVYGTTRCAMRLQAKDEGDHAEGCGLLADDDGAGDVSVLRCATGISPRAFSAARTASRSRRCRDMTGPFCAGCGSGLVPGSAREEGGQLRWNIEDPACD